MKGKLIVIDGTDGVGKTTQSNLLISYLKKSGKKVKSYDFPQYSSSFFGKMVAAFLKGEYGTLKNVSPYLISLPYALDRASVSQEIRKHLARGYWVVCNRYTPSSLSHQLAKVTPKERKKLYDFIVDLEYTQLGVVKEDMVIVLSLPESQRAKLIKNRSKKDYLKGEKLDIAEKDKKHQETSATMYQWLAKSHPQYRLIKCNDRKGVLLSIEKIHELVVQSLHHARIKRS